MHILFNKLNIILCQFRYQNSQWRPCIRKKILLYTYTQFSVQSEILMFWPMVELFCYSAIHCTGLHSVIMRRNHFTPQNKAQVSLWEFHVPKCWCESNASHNKNITHFRILYLTLYFKLERVLCFDFTL